MKCRANGANGLPIIVALMASVHANRPWQSRPAVPAMRCSGSCYKANGAAGRIAAALVLMRATRLSPGRTQAAAEPTARPTAAAVSTDSTTKMVASASVASVRMRREFGDIETASCLLLCATRMHRVHHVQCGAAGVNGLLIAALTASAHADRPCH